jgi:hypothetical protein
MSHEDNVEEVRKAILRQGQPRLVVFDTLARNFGGGDENSTADMGHFVNLITQFQQDLKTTVILVHHTGQTNKHRARGSSSLLGGIDYEYRIDKPSPYRCSMTNTKMKDAPEPEPLWFKMVESIYEESFEEGAEPQGSLVPVLTAAPVEEVSLKPSERQLYDLVKEVGSIDVGEAVNKVPIARSTFFGAIKGLVDKGLIEHYEDRLNDLMVD